MLRSKMHRPWQPRVSGSQLFNPSAHTIESDTSFSEGIEEVEGEVHSPAESRDPASAIDSSNAADEVASPAAAPEGPGAKARWYAGLVGRLGKH